VRSLFLIAFIANLSLIAFVCLANPGTVAIHFGWGGIPDSWAPASFNAIAMVGISLMLFLIFWFTPQLLRAIPTRWLSLPNRDYWTAPENRERMIAMLSGRMFEFGTLTFVLLFLVGLLVYQANRAEPVRLREDLFLWAMGLYLLYTIFWTIKLFLLFRRPGVSAR